MLMFSVIFLDPLSVECFHYSRFCFIVTCYCFCETMQTVPQVKDPTEVDRKTIQELESRSSGLG